MVGHDQDKKNKVCECKVMQKASDLHWHRHRQWDDLLLGLQERQQRQQRTKLLENLFRLQLLQLRLGLADVGAEQQQLEHDQREQEAGGGEQLASHVGVLLCCVGVKVCGEDMCSETVKYSREY